MHTYLESQILSPEIQEDVDEAVQQHDLPSEQYATGESAQSTHNSNNNHTECGHLLRWSAGLPNVQTTPLGKVVDILSQMDYKWLSEVIRASGQATRQFSTYLIHPMHKSNDLHQGAACQHELIVLLTMLMWPPQALSASIKQLIFIAGGSWIMGNKWLWKLITGYWNYLETTSGIILGPSEINTNVGRIKTDLRNVCSFPNERQQSP
ncbi:hypothetical protein EDC04DRAFT_2607993 [Pisolithus marmoratus]|nr:hypothetical protein EDC04DRAFT_2607993 [Pisolithus marmoratus]